uniref:PLAT domain-containing protein n=1 Tax=Bursaphelenchus xylophilus TaxID=6326 RepID=A0A1I7SVB1_BURXY
MAWRIEAWSQARLKLNHAHDPQFELFLIFKAPTNLLTASPAASPAALGDAANLASSEASISPLHSSSDNSVRTRSKRSSSSSSKDWKHTENCSYSIVVRTSKEPKAGTNANVFVQLTDEDGVQTDKLRLKCSITHRQKFRRGHSDLFLLVDQNQLSNLKYVDVWHQRKKPGATWLLHSINVIEHHGHQLYRFPYCKTIGDDDETADISHARLAVVGEPVKVLTAEDFQITN